jgi:hypothetical protein
MTAPRTAARRTAARRTAARPPAGPGTVPAATPPPGGTAPGRDATATARPGLDPRRLARLIDAAIERCELDLSGLTVLTEAASGAYAVTPVLAARAGARVLALAGPTRYATAAELAAGTAELAARAGVTGRIELLPARTPEAAAAADIVTNSGQVRPIDAGMAALLKPSAVVPLMYESWEYRAADVDLAACRRRGIAVAGTNETHPAVGVFSFLGPMAVRALHEAGVAVYGSRVVLLCDNPFGPHITGYLRGCGAVVAAARELTPVVLEGGCDAVVCALRPGPAPVLGAAAAALLAGAAPGSVLIQYWGDADRAALAAAGVPVWPPQPPPAGHMGVLPSAVGPEPVVRLQAGGLKVGELLARGLATAGPGMRALAQPL